MFTWFIETFFPRKPVVEVIQQRVKLLQTNQTIVYICFMNPFLLYKQDLNHLHFFPHYDTESFKGKRYTLAQLFSAFPLDSVIADGFSRTI